MEGESDCSPPRYQAAAISGSRLASRRRATSAAAAAPNSSTIGGAGTGTPPVELDVLPPLELDELEELEDVDVLLPPKLDELVEELVETLPLDDEEVDEEDDTLPLDDEVEDTLPDEVEVELPPVELDVELPPVEVELPPVEVELPPVEVDPPLVDVDPPVLVDDTITLLLLPLRENALAKAPAEKNPLAKALESLLAATTTGTAAKPEEDGTIGGSGGGGTGIGIGGVCAIVRVVTAAPGAIVQAVRRTVRRTTLRATARRTWWPPAALTLVRWTTAGRSGGFSCTWTAPPPMIAPPHVQAQSFAKAIRTDIPDLSPRPPSGLVLKKT